MLKKRFRLRKQRDIEKMFKEGDCFYDKLLFIRTLKNGTDITRFGFIVSNKVSSVAARRNRIKRIMRETIRSYQGRLEKGFDCVIVARKSIENAGSNEIRAVVEKMLKRSGLLRKYN